MIISEEMLYESAPKARDLWLSTLPQRADIPGHTFSKQFEKKMEKLLRRPKRAVHLKTFRRAVAAVLIIATVTFSAAMTVDAAFRERVIEVIVHVFNELTDYRFVAHEPVTDQYKVPEHTATDFGYVPDGFVEKENIRSADYEYIRYENNDGRFFELDCERVLPEDSFHMILDTEGSEYEKFYIEEKEVYLNIKNGNIVILWVDDSSVYHLRSNLPLEELKKIASEIK